MRNLLLAAALPLLFTAGCSIIYKQPIYQGNLIKKEAVDQLKIGMNKQEVAMLLGTPSISDIFHTDRWDYTSTQRINRVAHTEIKNPHRLLSERPSHPMGRRLLPEPR